MKGIPEKKNRVISASRREDMTAFRPEDLAGLIHGRGKGPLSSLRPDNIHSLVIWTKDFRNLLREPLRSAAAACGQVVVMFTATGLGGTALEPGVPEYATLLKQIPELVDFLGNPQRLIWRFDPLIKAASPNGSEQITNMDLKLFKEMASHLAALGVHRVIVSPISPYPKTVRRLGCLPGPNQDQALAFALEMAEVCRHLGMSLQSCCSLPALAGPCIDHGLLEKLHPAGELINKKGKPGQRPGCLCHWSWDIGWYYPCPHGCLYCYARPESSQGLSRNE